VPGPKDNASAAAKKVRDAEVKTYDKEIKKWKHLYARWKVLVDADDMAGARAKQPQLDKQSKVVDRCHLVLEGKMEAMDALQGAGTLAAAKTAIDGLINKESIEIKGKKEIREIVRKELKRA
jgi:hypothetical protein